MKDFWDWLVNNGDGVTAVAAVVLVVVVYGQLRLARRAFRLGDERLKKQSTLEFYTSVMDSVNADRSMISAKYGKDPIPEDNAGNLYKAAYKTEEHNIDADTVALGMAVRNYLNALERLAVGVYSRVYDEDLLRRLAFNHFKYVREQFPPYISEVQQYVTEAHTEARRLAEEWKDKIPVSGWAGDGSMGRTGWHRMWARIRDFSADRAAK